MYVQRNTETRSCNHCCRGKAVCNKYFACVSVFLSSLTGTQCACAVLYCQLWPLWLCRIFQHGLINSTTFGGGGEFTEHKYVFNFLCNVCWKISPSRKNSARYYHVKCTLCLSNFNANWIFKANFRKKKHRYQIPWKSVQWEPTCAMRTDGQRDRNCEGNSRFSQFCESA